MGGSEDPEVTRLTLLTVRLIKAVSVLWLPAIFLILSGVYTVADLEPWSPAVQSTLNISLVISLVLSIIVFLVSNDRDTHVTRETYPCSLYYCCTLSLAM